MADRKKTAKAERMSDDLRLSHLAIKVDGTLFPDSLKMKVEFRYIESQENIPL